MLWRIFSKGGAPEGKTCEITQEDVEASVNLALAVAMFAEPGETEPAAAYASL